jgi:hypothetical protein
LRKEVQKRFEEGRAAARQRVIDRGIVAFRADAEMMDMLLRVSEHKRVPYGVLARSWVMEHLHAEAESLKPEASSISNAV